MSEETIKISPKSAESKKPVDAIPAIVPGIIGDNAILVMIPEIKILIDLIKPPFTTAEIWKSLRAAAAIGEKIETFISSLGGISLQGSVAASAVTDWEIVSQVESHLAGIQPIAKGSGATEAEAVKLDPILTSLLITLIGRAVDKFGEWLKNRK